MSSVQKHTFTVCITPLNYIFKQQLLRDRQKCIVHYAVYKKETKLSFSPPSHGGKYC